MEGAGREILGGEKWDAGFLERHGSRFVLGGRYLTIACLNPC